MTLFLDWRNSLEDNRLMLPVASGLREQKYRVFTQRKYCNGTLDQLTHSEHGRSNAMKAARSKRNAFEPSGIV